MLIKKKNLLNGLIAVELIIIYRKNDLNNFLLL